MKRILFLLLLFTMFTGFVQAEILVDGRMVDWAGVTPVYVDPLGDGAAGSVDFDSLWVTEEYGFLIIRANLNCEVLMQGTNDLELLIDRDNSSETGVEVHGLGADIIWRFGERSGTYYGNGSSESLNQFEIGIVTAPTVTAEQFEISLVLSKQLDGEFLLPAGEIRLMLIHDTQSGDTAPDTDGLLFTIPSGDPGSPVALTIPEDPDNDDSVTRFVTWNVLFDGFMDRPEPFHRILAAIQPEIIVFEEMWDTSPTQVISSLNSWLPVEGGWNAAKEEGNIVLATPNEIIGTWDISGARATAFLVEMNGAPGSEMLVIGAHPPCCDNNEARQLEIDAIMAWLREAKEGNGPPDLDAFYSVVVTGDMNLVGYREQLETLVDGTIINQSEYGPSFGPDFDGSSLTDAFPRHVTQNQVYTWRDDSSNYSPGKLDYIIYSDTVLDPVNMFVFDTRTVSSTTLEELGVYEDDSETASDHMPVVVDFEMIIDTVSEMLSHASPEKWVIWSVSPNPTNASLMVSMSLKRSINGSLGVYDILGREVIQLKEGRFSAGNHVIGWNGCDRHGVPVASGRYFLRLEGNHGSTHLPLTIVE